MIECHANENWQSEQGAKDMSSPFQAEGVMYWLCWVAKEGHNVLGDGPLSIGWVCLLSLSAGLEGERLIKVFIRHRPSI